MNFLLSLFWKYAVCHSVWTLSEFYYIEIDSAFLPPWIADRLTIYYILWLILYLLHCFCRRWYKPRWNWSIACYSVYVPGWPYWYFHTRLYFSLTSESERMYFETSVIFDLLHFEHENTARSFSAKATSDILNFSFLKMVRIFK